MKGRTNVCAYTSVVKRRVQRHVSPLFTSVALLSLGTEPLAGRGLEVIQSFSGPVAIETDRSPATGQKTMLIDPGAFGFWENRDFTILIFFHFYF